MLPRSKILGTGAAFPPQVIDNDRLMPLIREEYPDAWDRADCEATFGVHTRRWAADFETGKILEGCSDIELSSQAARKAITMADIDPAEIDLIIHTTVTPDYFVDPDPAIEILNTVAPKADAAALTVPVTCVGMTHSMIMADSHIKSGLARTVLLTASNIVSPGGRGVPWQMRFFVGDAAAAAVVRATNDDDGSGVIGAYWGSHRGQRGTRMGYNTIGNLGVEALGGEFFPDAVAKEGGPLFGRSVKKLRRNHPNVKPDWIVTHQANPLFQRFASRAFEVPTERVPYNLQDFGNTLDASCGTVLDLVIGEGRAKRGDVVAMLAVGTGWHWSTCLFRF
jgi:3-oxoacyl-[acyl-carrier-protein] synthase III